MSDPRTQAPFGRRLARIESNDRLGAYRLLAARDAGGPRDPQPGQFYMLAAAERWGGEDERPYLPRAFSYARAHGDGLLEFLNCFWNFFIAHKRLTQSQMGPRESRRDCDNLAQLLNLFRSWG